MTLSELRQQGYWILHGRSAVSSYIVSCVPCRKLRGPFLGQKTADLPVERHDELLRTLMCEVEDILNSPPIPVADMSPTNKLEPLTPSSLPTQKCRTVVVPFPVGSLLRTTLASTGGGHERSSWRRRRSPRGAFQLAPGHRGSPERRRPRAQSAGHDRAGDARAAGAPPGGGDTSAAWPRTRDSAPGLDCHSVICDRAQETPVRRCRQTRVRRWRPRGPRSEALLELR